MWFSPRSDLSAIFLPPPAVYVCVLIVYLSICLGFFFFCLVFFFWGGGGCVCLDYSRTNNRSLFKNLWVGPDWRKKLLKERSGSYFGYQKIMIFRGLISMYFNDFSFLLDISMKINLHVRFYFIVFLKILYITWETGHMESSVLFSLSASCLYYNDAACKAIVQADWGCRSIWTFNTFSEIISHHKACYW